MTDAHTFSFGLDGRRAECVVAAALDHVSRTWTKENNQIQKHKKFAAKKKMKNSKTKGIKTKRKMQVFAFWTEVNRQTQSQGASYAFINQ